MLFSLSTLESLRCTPRTWISTTNLRVYNSRLHPLLNYISISCIYIASDFIWILSFWDRLIIFEELAIFAELSSASFFKLLSFFLATKSIFFRCTFNIEVGWLNHLVTHDVTNCRKVCRLLLGLLSWDRCRLFRHFTVKSLALHLGRESLVWGQVVLLHI